MASSSVLIHFKLCFLPISLSFLSCAGVIFKAPVPNAAEQKKKADAEARIKTIEDSLANL